MNPQYDTIPEANIIAVLPVHASLPDDYTILYVVDNAAAKDDSKASPVIFKSVIATNLPRPFIHDFQPSGESCWTIRHDNTTSIPSVHIIISTGSGTGLAQDVWERLLKPMLSQVCGQEASKMALHMTSSEQSVAELTRDVILPRANDGIAQAIALFSGDGGIVDIVNVLLSERRTRQYAKPNIGIFPVGTGNALAHSIGVTGDNTMGLKTVIQGVPKDLPIFRASFSAGARLLVNEGREERELHNLNGVPTVHGAVVCSWGFHAALVADSDTTEFRKFGAERFKMAGKEALFPSDGSPPHAYKGKVSVLNSTSKNADDWQSISADGHGYVLATLVSSLEKGFVISPASKPLDGVLRLVYFEALSGKDVMEIMTKAYDGGKHLDDERVRYEEIEGLRIGFEEDDARWRRVCVDGKIVRVEKGGWVEVRKERAEIVDIIAM